MILAANANANSIPGDAENIIQYDQQELAPITPTYLDDVYGSSAWASNWFISVKGGMSAFIGKPVGHGDIFDRTKIVFNGAVGKWFNPYFGARAAFQGFKLYDSDINSRSFQNAHLDLMYNVTSHLRTGFETLPRWNVIPYLGCGIIRTSNAGNVRQSHNNKPFAVSYGLIAQYRIARRFHIEGELGGSTTWQSLDGIGANNKPGDNLFHASIGLTATIGKVGYRRVIDPKPYILQNDILMEYLQDMKDQADQLLEKQKKDAMALAEMRKILEIEGLLEKYDLELPESEHKKAFPKNNYSGLNSLRARLREKNGEIAQANTSNMEFQPHAFSNGDGDEAELKPEDYFRVMKDGKVFIGSPIFFFFKLAKDELTEKAQMINIREVASTIKRFGLSARVVGAADSQTGTAVINERLSAKRADYIARVLRENGVPEERITTQFQGGISTYVPMEGNRNTCVMLYYK